MIVVNTETITGYIIIEVKGLVQGNTIRAKHIGRDVVANLKNLVGDQGYGSKILEYAQKLLSWRMQNDERILTGMKLTSEGVVERQN